MIDTTLPCKCGEEAHFWNIEGGWCKKHWGESLFMRPQEAPKEKEDK